MWKNILAILVFSSSTILASGYVDPSVRVKKPLLEEPADEVKTSKMNVAPEVIVKNPDIAQYCACKNFKRLVTKKKEIIDRLIYNRVIEDSDWSLRERGDREIKASVSAIKKVIYKKSIDVTEVECDLIPLNYKKASELKPAIASNQKICRYVDI